MDGHPSLRRVRERISKLVADGMVVPGRFTHCFKVFAGCSAAAGSFEGAPSSGAVVRAFKITLRYSWICCGAGGRRCPRHRPSSSKEENSEGSRSTVAAPGRRKATVRAPRRSHTVRPVLQSMDKGTYKLFKILFAAPSGDLVCCSLRVEGWECK